MNKVCWFALLALLTAGSGLAQAETLDEELSALKADVAKLNTALFELEENILYPANTQLAVFLSLDVKDYFQLDSIEISVDGLMASSHLYSPQEREALRQGGIQRLYLGNLAPGVHELTATLNGQGANGHYFRKQQHFSITKDGDAERVELAIQARPPSHDPQFTLKRWQ